MAKSYSVLDLVESSMISLAGCGENEFRLGLKWGRNFNHFGSGKRKLSFEHGRNMSVGGVVLASTGFSPLLNRSQKYSLGGISNSPSPIAMAQILFEDAQFDLRTSRA